MKAGRPKKSSIFSKKSSIYSRRFQNECSTYEKVLPYAPADVDQLAWWKIHQEALPLLAFMVRVTFAIPVASSKSERVFSVAVNVVTQKRELCHCKDKPLAVERDGSKKINILAEIFSFKSH